LVFFLFVLVAPELVQAIARALQRGAELLPKAAAAARQILRAVLVAAPAVALLVRVILRNPLREATFAMRTVVQHLARHSNLFAADAAHKAARVKALPAPLHLRRAALL
jgi:fructose-specific phosphotransferase system IIC component